MKEVVWIRLSLGQGASGPRSFSQSFLATPSSLAFKTGVS